MLLVPHTLVGVLIATFVPNPIISFPLAFISHFFADLVPHWDFFTFGVKLDRRTVLRIAGDFTLGLAVGLFFAFRALPDQLQFVNIIGCCFLSNLPDGLELPYLFGRRDGWIKGLLAIQRRFHCKAGLPWGLVTQAVSIVLCLFAIFLIS